MTRPDLTPLWDFGVAGVEEERPEVSMEGEGRTDKEGFVVEEVEEVEAVGFFVEEEGEPLGEAL